MTRIRFLLFCGLLLPGLAWSQEDGDGAGADEAPWGAVFLDEEHSAAIPIPNPDHSVRLVLRENQAGEAKYWIRSQIESSGFSLFPTPLMPNQNGLQVGRAGLALNPRSDNRSWLDLRLLLEHNLLLYRWRGSDTRFSGGFPVMEESALNTGEPIPDFVVETLDGESVRPSDYEGKVLVINWWTISCIPCIEEMPRLNSLVEKYDPDDAAFLAINDMDSEEALRSFFVNHPFTYQQALSSEKTSAIFGSSWPRHVIIDKTGTIFDDQGGGGANTYQELDAKIAMLLESN